MKLGGWGRYPLVEAELTAVRSVTDIQQIVAAGPCIPRGLGRSYGDSALGRRVIDISGLDAMVSFDPETGSLTCEAGVTLSEILQRFVPRGWFLPVTPGTRFVTVGGAVASDVHGKNHHKDGTFCDHVTSMRLMVASGEVLEISRTSHPELFHATCGGMGLTGIIVEVTFTLLKVQSRNVEETLIKAPSLDVALDTFDQYYSSTYSVAWIDLLASGASLGRSLVMIGEHARDGDLGSASDRVTGTIASMPVDLPSGLLNKVTVKAFNMLYYQRIRSALTVHTVPYEPFFYPLDKVGDWNRVYGGQGFLQYQFAMPFGSGGEGRVALREVIGRIAAAGLASPLAVLKLFGPANEGPLSFPTSGYTLALDFKATDQAFKLCDELDRLVLSAGGRLYLTKDARMTRETFEAGYPRLAEFEAVRARYGASGVFVSTQSQRLGLA